MLASLMPRARIVARLAIVEDQIGLAQASVESQRSVVDELRRNGYATGSAETNLTLMKAKLVIHLAERERLRAELAAMPRQDQASQP